MLGLALQSMIASLSIVYMNGLCVSKLNSTESKKIKPLVLYYTQGRHIQLHIACVNGIVT